jgi:hypothetical protein
MAVKRSGWFQNPACFSACFGVFRFLAVLALAALFPYVLAAQDSGTRIAKTGGGFLVFQRISFPPAPDALRYKVEIEQLAGENFIPLETVQTETNSVEVSLRGGSYRYRIFAYNRMNLADGVSEWREFEVLVAFEPVVETYRPFYGLYYKIAGSTGSITVTGRDFFPESEFALVKNGGRFDWSGVELEGRGGVFFPDKVEVSEDHATAVLYFTMGSLEPGQYFVFVRNPGGGLWDTLGRVQAGFKNKVDWTLSFGYLPLIAAFDRGKATFSDGLETKPRLDLFNPYGAYLRLGWFPVKHQIGKFGFELNLIFLADNEDYREFKNESPNAQGYFSTISGGHLDMVYQTAPVSWQGWQIEVRAGIGSGDPYDDTRDYYNNEQDIPVPLLLNFGFSAQYFFWKNLYAETGLDFQYMTRAGHFMLRPALGLGWQFGRWSEVDEVKRALRRGKDPSVPVTGIPKNELTLSLGWSPMIPLFDYEYTQWDGAKSVKKADLEPVNLAGAFLRMAWLTHRWDDNKFGFEFALYVLDHPNRETYDSPYNYIDILRYGYIGILYQRRLPEKDWQANARLGAGTSNPYDPRSENVEIPLVLNAGLSIQRFFRGGLYAEAGFDFAVSFGREPHLILNPGIGLGWQFNRDAETGLRLK